MAYQFELDGSPGRQLTRILSEQVACALGASRASDVPLHERVHDARRACKRIRAALRLVRGNQPEVWHRENASFRDAARELAPLREAAVMPHTLAGVIKHFADAMDARTFAPLQRQVSAYRRSIVSDVRANTRALSQFADRMSGASHRFAKLKLKLEASELIAEFGQAYRRSRRAWHRIRADSPADDFHECRKRTKTHANQCRLLRCAWPKMMRARQHQLGELGDGLGEEHDLVMLDRWLAQSADRASTQSNLCLRGLIAVRREQLRKRSILLGKRLFAEKPSALVCHVSAWWEIAGELAE